MRSIYDFVPTPVAHWPMNDNLASTVVKEVVAGQNGTAQRNTNLMHAIGKKGGALTFNGSSDYVNTNDSFQSTFRDSFSISLWVKPDDGQPLGSEYLVGCTDAWPSNIIRLYITSAGKVGAAITSNADMIGTVGDAASFTDGQQDWHMITMVVEKITASTARVLLYFDGILLKTGTTSACVLGDYTNANDPSFGALNGAGVDSNWFAGPIDDVMIFKALTARQVKKLYDFLRGKESIYGPRPNRLYHKNINSGIFGEK